MKQMYVIPLTDCNDISLIQEAKKKWTNVTRWDRKKILSIPHSCRRRPSSCEPCTVVGLVAETWLV